MHPSFRSSSSVRRIVAGLAVIATLPLFAAPAAAQGQSDTSFKTTLIAEPRSNALILRAANPARVAQVRAAPRDASALASEAGVAVAVLIEMGSANL